jgi:hypothetical protein
VASAREQRSGRAWRASSATYQLVGRDYRLRVSDRSALVAWTIEELNQRGSLGASILAVERTRRPYPFALIVALAACRIHDAHFLSGEHHDGQRGTGAWLFPLRWMRAP